MPASKLKMFISRISSVVNDGKSATNFIGLYVKHSTFVTLVLLVITLFVPERSARATNYTWNANSVTNWETPSAWTPTAGASGPQSTDSVLANSGTGTLQFGSSGTYQVVDFYKTLNGAWTVQNATAGLNTTFKVTGTLAATSQNNFIFSGNSGTLNIDAGAVSITGGGVVFGNVGTVQAINNLTTGSFLVGQGRTAFINATGVVSLGAVTITGNSAQSLSVVNTNSSNLSRTVTVSSLSSAGTGTNTLQGNSGGSGTNNLVNIVHNGNSGTTTFTGVIQNGAGGGTTLSLTKTGSNTQILTGANTYTGSTTVSAGTLVLSGSGSIASSSVLTLSTTNAVLDVSAANFTLQGGQSLRGIGTIIGNVATANSSILSPGNGAGTLKITGNTTLGNGTLFSYDSGDLVAITGDLTLGTGLVLNAATNLGAGNYDLFTYTGSLVNVGNLASWTATGLTNSYSFLSDGDSVYLSVTVPEPSTWALLGSAFGFALWRVGRRKS